MKALVEYYGRRGFPGEAWRSDIDNGQRGRWILIQTRNAAHCVWTTGKRLTLWTLVLGSIPILLPVFVFSLFAGLLFAAPLLCGIGAYFLLLHVLSPSTSKPLPRDDDLPHLQSPELHHLQENSVSCLPLSDDDDKEQKKGQEVVDISPGYEGSETGNDDGLEVSMSKEVSDSNGHHDDEGETSTTTPGTEDGEATQERTADALSFHTARLGDAGAEEGDSEELLESNGSTNSCLEQGWPLPLQSQQAEDFRRVEEEEEEEEAAAESRVSTPPPKLEERPEGALVGESQQAEDFRRDEEEEEEAVSTPPPMLEKRPEGALVGEKAVAAESLVGYPPVPEPDEVLKKEAALAASLVSAESSKLEERPEEAQITTAPSDVTSSLKEKGIDEVPKMGEESEKDSMTRKMPGTIVPHEVEILPVQSLHVTIPQSEYVIPRHLDGTLNGEERGNNNQWLPKAPSSIADSPERNNDEGYAPISPLSMYEEAPPQQHHRFKEFGKGFKEWPEHRSDIITSRSSEFPPGSTTSIESIDVFSGEFEGLLSYWREKDKGKLFPAYPPSTAEVACHLRSEITVIQRILGEEFAPQYSIWKDVEKLSEIVGVQLPDMGDVSDLTKARIGLDLLRVVVGVKDIDDAPTSSI
jgi:hypothetical protein